MCLSLAATTRQQIQWTLIILAADLDRLRDVSTSSMFRSATRCADNIYGAVSAERSEMRATRGCDESTEGLSVKNTEMAIGKF